jgi:hypothetical protein
MSYSLYATGIDACDPIFIRNKDAFLRGEFFDKEIKIDDAVEETGEEYGGLIIDLEKIPRNVTHILVGRY